MTDVHWEVASLPDRRISAERWKTIEPLIDEAVALAPEARLAFLDSVCEGDAPLRAELVVLLEEYDRKDSPIDRPAAERFASLFSRWSAPQTGVLGERYRIERELGRGGMATVYLAHDIRHERPVAVKILHPELAAALGAELFLAEIKTTARLHHQHILPLHDSGDADGLLYYVMPYVAGGTLRDRLTEERPLAIDEVVRITTEVASALDAAHRRGVIHRDIKPENILLHDGSALIADFGIALAVSAAAAGGVAKPGLILGTRQYMSPEQAAGNGVVDGRADVYSLGLVVYEMLGGHLPVDGVSAETTVASPQRIHALRDELPAAVDPIVARALATLPADRYATAGNFAGELRQVLTASPIHDADRTHQPRRVRRATQLFVAAGFLLAIGGITLMQRSRAGVPRHRGSATQAQDYFDRGMAWMDDPGRTAAGVARAESLFKLAIAADSNLADAHARLAQINVSYAIGNLGDYEPREYLLKARKEALGALSLDSTVAQAHVSLANVSMFYEMDWARAERELARAQKLDSLSMEARNAKVTLLEYLGRIGDAVREARDAVALQPRAELPKVELARALFFDRQYPAATEQITWLLERDSSRFRARLLLGEVLAEQGKYDSAVSEMQAAVRSRTNNSRSHAYLAHVYARAGRAADARRELGAIYNKSRRGFVPALDFAIAYVGFRDMDSTFAWLNKAIDDHTMRPYVFDPTFKPIRSDPRYAELLARMHLAERP